MSASKGEDIIASLLQSQQIFYETEKLMPGMKHDGYSLRFDFYLPALAAAIEFDGIQHYQSIPYFGGRKGLLKCKENDRRKNRFCLAHNIKLYRIPYWDLSKLSSAADLFRQDYLVQSQWHNDRLTPPNS